MDVNTKIDNTVKTMFKISLSSSQINIVKKVLDPTKKRIVISAFTRYGKTFTVAIATILYLISNPGSKIMLVSPKIDQTRIIRDYIANFIVDSGMAEDLIDFSSDKSSRIKKEISKSMITFKNGCILKMLSAQGTGERLMGWGADILILDESCLIDHEVYRSKISRMLGDNPNSKLVEIGNPWHRNNQMYEHWLDSSFTHIHIGYELGLKEGRITNEFLEEQRNLLSPTEFQILYKAEFPEETEDSLFKLEWLKEAERDINEPVQGFKGILGVDVARYGEDLTVLTYNKKYDNLNYITKIKDYSKKSITQTAGIILQFCKEHKVDIINVDDTGLGGGLTDVLKERFDDSYNLLNSHNPDVNAIIVGARSEVKNNLNIKTDLFIALKKHFENGNIIIPKHSVLKNQLSKMLYEITSSGKVKIVDNQDKSPDFADSLAYACYDRENEVIIDW
jgi:phage FluMu gp28-like protein